MCLVLAVHRWASLHEAQRFSELVSLKCPIPKATEGDEIRKVAGIAEDPEC